MIYTPSSTIDIEFCENMHVLFSAIQKTNKKET